jgi:hypothetical protein
MSRLEKLFNYLDRLTRLDDGTGSFNTEIDECVNEIRKELDLIK